MCARFGWILCCMRHIGTINVRVFLTQDTATTHARQVNINVECVCCASGFHVLCIVLLFRVCVFMVSVSDPQQIEPLSVLMKVSSHPCDEDHTTMHCCNQRKGGSINESCLKARLCVRGIYHASKRPQGGDGAAPADPQRIRASPADRRRGGCQAMPLIGPPRFLFFSLCCGSMHLSHQKALHSQKTPFITLASQDQHSITPLSCTLSPFLPHSMHFPSPLSFSSRPVSIPSPGGVSNPLPRAFKNKANALSCPDGLLIRSTLSQ